MTHTVLAVDDSNSMRQMVAYTLRSVGYKVVEAVDGEDALEKLRLQAAGERIGLVLTDQNMPGMDGLTLVRRLRRLSGYESVPILILTTESNAEIKNQGRAAGATGWLSKPFDPDRLIEVVRKVIG